MSSLRNSLHRRNHKERGQLAHRAKLGILEKHKDYVLRARDYHSKQDRLTRLRQKAAERNKDEFYFGMIRQKTREGVHIQDRGNEALPTDVVKVLKSQDENYIRTMRLSNQKKIDKLKAQLTALADLLKADLIEGEDEDLDEEELEVLQTAGILASGSETKRKWRESTSKHIIFADDEEEGKSYVPPAKPQLASDDMDVEEDDADLGWKLLDDSGNHKRKKGKARADAESAAAAAEEKRQEEATDRRTRLLKELAARLNRDRLLRYTERELQMQKALMGKGAAKKLQGVERVDDDNDEDEEDEERRPKKVDEKLWKPRVYKWRVERKR